MGVGVGADDPPLLIKVRYRGELKGFAPTVGVGVGVGVNPGVSVVLGVGVNVNVDVGVN